MKLNVSLSVNKAYILSFVNLFNSTLTRKCYLLTAVIVSASFRI